MREPPAPSPEPDRSRTPSGQSIRFLVVGRLLGPVGVSGDLRAQLLTDFPERFPDLRTVHLGDNLRPYRVVWARLEGGTAVLHLSGVDDVAAAQGLANQDVQIPIDAAAELPADQYFWHQILGLAVWSDDGVYLGTVVEVMRTGSNDVYLVRNGTRDALIPAIEDVVREVDLEQRRMIVHLLPGLVD